MEKNNAFEQLAELERLYTAVQSGVTENAAATAERIVVLIKDLAFYYYYGLRSPFFDHILKTDPGAREIAKAVYDEESAAASPATPSSRRFRGTQL